MYVEPEKIEETFGVKDLEAPIGVSAFQPYPHGGVLKAWGIAGRGMYWRPVLLIEVTPDAEFRYAELKALLDNSGLIVQRRQS